MTGELIPTGVTFGVGRNSINDAFSGTAYLNNIKLDSGGDFSGGTGGGVIYSGGTDLYDIFSTGGGGATASNGLTKTGDNITLGGALTGDTTVDIGSNELLIDAGNSGTFVLSGNAGGDEQILIANYNLNQNTSLVVAAGKSSLNGANSAGTITSLVQASAGNNPGVFLQVFNGLASSSVLIQESDMTISDSINTKGIVYANNYHPNYTNRSLVDKEYVDNKAKSGATGSTIISLSAADIYKISGDSGVSGQITFETNNIPGEPASLQVGKGSARLFSESGTSSSFISTTSTDVIIDRSIGALGSQEFSLKQNLGEHVMYIQDTINSRGLEYAGNYHANYTNRTLVDYEYVNNHVASAATSGSEAFFDFGTTAGTITWDVSTLSKNAKITLSGNVTLNVTNASSGNYGTLKVYQDAVGSRTLTLGAGTHRVVNSGGGSITLTSSANALDITSFVYDGSEFSWNVGNDYS